MPRENTTAKPAEFGQVLEQELNYIKARRAKVLGGGDPSPPVEVAGPIDEKAARLKALGMRVTCLAFSGGGIRSATFALGVLQGLAYLRLLKRFDYLSTVSGGGYIGGWLAAWT